MTDRAREPKSSNCPLCGTETYDLRGNSAHCYKFDCPVVQFDWKVAEEWSE